MAECLPVATPRGRGKETKSTKPKTKSQVKKKPRSQAKNSKERKAKRQAKNQEEAIKKARKEGLKSNSPTARHTTNPPGPCLGRSFLIPNVRKARA
jgi:hypothetical protein